MPNERTLSYGIGVGREKNLLREGEKKMSKDSIVAMSQCSNAVERQTEARKMPFCRCLEMFLCLFPTNFGSTRTPFQWLLPRESRPSSNKLKLNVDKNCCPIDPVPQKPCLFSMVKEGCRDAEELVGTDATLKVC